MAAVCMRKDLEGTKFRVISRAIAIYCTNAPGENVPSWFSAEDMRPDLQRKWTDCNAGVLGSSCQRPCIEMDHSRDEWVGHAWVVLQIDRIFEFAQSGVDTSHKRHGRRYRKKYRQTLAWRMEIVFARFAALHCCARRSKAGALGDCSGSASPLAVNTCG